VGAEEEEGLEFVAQLIERGWTPTLVRKILGDPDATARNPHRRSGPPVKLYAAAKRSAVGAG